MRTDSRNGQFMNHFFTLFSTQPRHLPGCVWRIRRSQGFPVFLNCGSLQKCSQKAPDSEWPVGMEMKATFD